MDTTPNGHDSEWTRSRIDTISNGHDPDGHDPDGHDSECTQCRMETIPNEHDPERMDIYPVITINSPYVSVHSTSELIKN